MRESLPPGDHLRGTSFTLRTLSDFNPHAGQSTRSTPAPRHDRSGRGPRGSPEVARSDHPLSTLHQEYKVRGVVLCSMFLARVYGLYLRRRQTRCEHRSDKPGGSSPRPGPNAAPLRMPASGRTLPAGNFSLSPGLADRSGEAGHPCEPQAGRAKQNQHGGSAPNRWAENKPGSAQPSRRGAVTKRRLPTRDFHPGQFLKGDSSLAKYWNAVPSQCRAGLA